MSVVLDLDPDKVALQRRVRELEEEVAEWKRRAANGHGDAGDEAEAFEPPEAWRLTPSEALMLRVLCAHKVATRQAIGMAFEDWKPGWSANVKIIDVFAMKLRQRLARFGVEIVTVWGQGWRLGDEHRRAVRAACYEGGPHVVGPVVEPAPSGMATRAAQVRAVLGGGEATARAIWLAIGSHEVDYNAVCSVLQVEAARGGLLRRRVADPLRRRPQVWAYSLPAEGGA